MTDTDPLTREEVDTLIDVSAQQMTLLDTVMKHLLEYHSETIVSDTEMFRHFAEWMNLMMQGNALLSKVRTRNPNVDQMVKDLQEKRKEQ